MRKRRVGIRSGWTQVVGSVTFFSRVLNDWRWPPKKEEKEKESERRRSKSRRRRIRKKEEEAKEEEKTR